MGQLDKKFSLITVFVVWILFLAGISDFVENSGYGLVLALQIGL